MNFFVVCLRHIREADAPLVVVDAGERVDAHEVYVVRYRGYRAGTEVGVDAARGVRRDERPDAEAGEDAHREGNLLHVVALVVMHAPLHRGDRLAAEAAEHETARVARRGGTRPVGYIFVGDYLRLLYALRGAAEARAEYDGGLRPDGGFLFDIFERFFDFVPVVHRVSSFTLRAGGIGRSSRAGLNQDECIFPWSLSSCVRAAPAASSGPCRCG